MITVWKAPGDRAFLHQLSEDPLDGTPQEQIKQLLSLQNFAGCTCVYENYTGSAPDGDPALWRWNGTELVSAAPVPQSVTPRQVRLLLLQQGLLDEVEAMIKTQDRATQITWDYALEFKRDDPLLDALAAGLGLTSEQIDQFFISAAAL